MTNEDRFPKFGRALKLGSRGKDVIAVKRALARAGYGDLSAKGTKTQLFGAFAVKNLKNFQKDHGLKPDGVFGEATFKKLYPYFDAYSKSLYEIPDEALAKAKAMIDFGYQFDNTYVYGGEHDSTVDDDSPHGYFDCSSSVSYLLWKFGLFGADPDSRDPAQISTWFETWGEPGPGKYVTVFSNSEHVWIRFTLPNGTYYRFDTSPHGDGGRGPRIRHSHRFESGFVARHPKGM